MFKSNTLQEHSVDWSDCIDVQTDLTKLIACVTRLFSIQSWALRTSNHEVLASNPAGGGIQLMDLERFIAQCISLSTHRCLDMT